MTYLVEFAVRAIRHLEILYVEKHAAESHAAARSYNGLEPAVYVLTAYPHRCSIVPEGRRVKRKLRHLICGKKPHFYRVIYEIDERRRAVWVLRIRHGARRRLKPSDRM